MNGTATINDVIANVNPSAGALADTLRRGSHGTNVDVRTHGGRTRELSLRVAAALGVLDELRDALMLGAILHDVGKLLLPPGLLAKKGPLNEREWITIRSHPEAGEEMLKGIAFLAPALPVIRHHHERWDGGGYPDCLAGDAIPLAARIVSVADTFDAMVSDRPYRKAMPMDDACAEILRSAGTQLDPQCANTFVELIKFSELTLGGMLRRRLRSDLLHQAS
jgi:HD-GYP domain-containing protein (c-di-GMP phosphodiesterase class II)